MERFVSALGPDVPPPKGYDVKYRQSTKTFAEAQTVSAAIRDHELRGTDLTTVIYRLSYDNDKGADKFFPFRQTDEELGGRQKSEFDNSSDAVAFEIYTAPASLLSDAATLDEQVDLIATHSQTREPGTAGPH
jgi:hypothetical protein